MEKIETNENPESVDYVSCSVCYETYAHATGSKGIFCSHRLSDDVNRKKIPKFICLACLIVQAKIGKSCYVCICQPCQKNTYKLLQRKLSNEDVKTFEIRAREHDLMMSFTDISYNMTELRPCLNAACRSIVDLGERDGKSVVCRSCNTRYCANKNCTFHYSNDPCNAPIEKSSLKKRIEFEKARKLVSSLPHIKPCPYCQCLLSNDMKEENVRCHMCKFYFCWSCLKATRKQSRYGISTCKCDGDSNNGIVITAIAVMTVAIAIPVLSLHSWIEKKKDKKEAKKGSSESLAIMYHRRQHPIHEPDIEDPDVHKSDADGN